MLAKILDRDTVCMTMNVFFLIFLFVRVHSVFVHFDVSVEKRSTKDDENTKDTNEGGWVTPNVKGHDGLDSCLGRTRYVVSERGCGFDLQDGDNTNGKTKESSNGHSPPILSIG